MYTCSFGIVILSALHLVFYCGVLAWPHGLLCGLYWGYQTVLFLFCCCGLVGIFLWVHRCGLVGILLWNSWCGHGCGLGTLTHFGVCSVALLVCLGLSVWAALLHGYYRGFCLQIPLARDMGAPTNARRNAHPSMGRNLSSSRRKAKYLKALELKPRFVLGHDVFMEKVETL